MTRVFVALGSNLGDRLAHIEQALQGITRLNGCSAVRASSVYETPPMGPQNQPDYLNSVCEFHCEDEPQILLRSLQEIEAAHGREEQRARWSARPLDLDILLFGQTQMRTPELTIPHAGIAERAFVLWPLAELDPELVIPGHGVVKALQQACPPDGIRVHTSRSGHQT